MLFRGLQTRLQKVEEHLQTQPCPARVLYRKVVFHRFLSNLCAFVSLCLVKNHET